MPHTYSNLVFHVVFSTKERIKFLTADRRSELFAYIVALVKEKGGGPGDRHQRCGGPCACVVVPAAEHFALRADAFRKGELEPVVQGAL